MAAHKFAVGQMVRFAPGWSEAATATARRGESFKIVRLLPESAGVLQYRVQSQRDSRRERVVREDQLARV